MRSLMIERYAPLALVLMALALLGSVLGGQWHASAQPLHDKAEVAHVVGGSVHVHEEGDGDSTLHAFAHHFQAAALPTQHDGLALIAAPAMLWSVVERDTNRLELFGRMLRPPRA